MGRYEVLLLKKDKMMDTEAIQGVLIIWIFGSVMRGEEKPDSEIDLLVELDPERSLLDHIGFIQDLHDILQCNVDVVAEKGVNRYLRNQVLQEYVPL
jgi:predicted nucleotidyltransferase